MSVETERQDAIGNLEDAVERLEKIDKALGFEPGNKDGNSDLIVPIRRFLFSVNDGPEPRCLVSWNINDVLDARNNLSDNGIQIDEMTEDDANLFLDEMEHDWRDTAIVSGNEFIERILEERWGGRARSKTG